MIGQDIAHDSAALHVSGAARYADDLPLPANAVHLALGQSPHAHARIRSMDLTAVRQAPGVVAVFTSADLPGVNDVGPVFAGDPIFADGLVEYAGQCLFAVAATDRAAARRALALAQIEYELLEPILTIDQALAASSHVMPPETMLVGDAAAALAAAPHRLAGRFDMGGQDHFYLESHIAVAWPQEDGDVLVVSSTQHPSEVQHLIARALALPDHGVTVEVRRMGGGFGGKETQSALFAAIAALAAVKLRRPAKLRPDRDDDMVMTGKRHDFRVDYDVGFDDLGVLRGLEITLSSRCGMSIDLSGAINGRAMLHVDNAYFLPHLRLVSNRLKTHTVSNTAFRGFGGPQGMLAIEYVMDEIARFLKLDGLLVRRRNLYGPAPRHLTHYGQAVTDTVLPDLLDRLEHSADYARRRQDVAAFNQDHRWQKRGLALTPVKFGVSFNTVHLNQAGALVHIYSDGSVMLNHGGTEMGQGVNTKVAQVVAAELGIALSQVKITATSTAKVPNTSATAASTGSDLNGKAAQNAARTLRDRLAAFAAARFGVAPDQVRFAGGQVWLADQPMGFADLVKQAYLARISLSATGFYRTPKLHWDKERLHGRPFYYYAYGAAVSEVLVDCLTGEYRLLRSDLLADCGASLNPALDRGQIEGAFVQGMGWLTMEELWWDGQGRLRTHAPSTYKIPVAADIPEHFNLTLWDRPNGENTIHRSKAVGEPPFMLALSVFFALKDAVAAGGEGDWPGRRFDAPATPERVLRALGGSSFSLV